MQIQSIEPLVNSVASKELVSLLAGATYHEHYFKYDVIIWAVR